MRDSIFLDAMELEIWLLTLVVLGVFALISWLGYRGARKRRGLADGGGLCLYCDSQDVSAEFAGVRCNTCGQLTSQMLLEAKGPSDAELREIMRPPKQE